MKKAVSLFLTLVLALSLAVPAFAAEYVEVVPCIYDYVGPFSEGLAVVTLNDKCGYIDKTGKEVVPCKYDSLVTHSYEGEFSEGLAMVALNGKYGYIDMTGKEVIPCQYDRAKDFSEGLAAVEQNGKWGYIDKTGKEVVPFFHSMDYGTYTLGYYFYKAYSFSDGLAMVVAPMPDGDMISYIDKTGREIVPFQYVSAWSFSNGFARVKRNDKWGCIDTTGKEVIPCQYDDRTGDISEGLAFVKQNGKWGYVDTTGKEVIPCQYDEVWSFSEGLAAVKQNGKWGYIDKTGNEVIPCQYEWAESFSEGLAAVKLNGKCGYIDKTGKVVVSCPYGLAYSFSGGFAKVCMADKWGFIDKTGREVVPCQYEYVADFSEGLSHVMKDGKYGFIAINASAPAPAPQVQRTSQKLTVDGAAKDTEIYNIDGSNYFKLRDMAALLGGTGSQFSVEYDAARQTIVVRTGAAYAPVGGELSVGQDKSATAVPSAQSIEINGTTASLTAYNIGGNNYFKLRELGTALNFGVDYDAATATMLVTSK